MQNFRLVLLSWVSAVGCQTWQPVEWTPGARLPEPVPEVRVFLKRDNPFASRGRYIVLLERPLVRPDSIIGYTPQTDERLAFPVQFVDFISVKRKSPQTTGVAVIAVTGTAAVLVLFIAFIGALMKLTSSFPQ